MLGCIICEKRNKQTTYTASHPASRRAALYYSVGTIKDTLDSRLYIHSNTNNLSVLMEIILVVRTFIVAIIGMISRT